MSSDQVIPCNPECSGCRLRVSTPKPHVLYGYAGEAFMHPWSPLFPAARATADGLRFPFFAIECGDLWVSVNKCAGASSASLNAVDQLNTSLPNHPGVQHVDNVFY